MLTVYPNLQAAMEQQGTSTLDLADGIGLSEDVVNLKMRGVWEWTLSEALAICRYLHYTDLRKLFLR